MKNVLQHSATWRKDWTANAVTTFLESMRSGSMIRVRLRSRGAVPTSVTDSVGNTYTLMRQRRLGRCTVSRWHALNGVSLPAAVTATFSCDPEAYVDMRVDEFAAI